MRALLLALALIVGAPTLAQARPPMETNQLVDGDGNPLGTATNPLAVTGGGGSAGGSVTPAGTNGTNAQAVQGIDNGVPQRVVPQDNWVPAGYPLTITGGGPQPGFAVPDGANSAFFELTGTAVVNIESSSDATTDTDGTWTTVFGYSPSDLNAAGPNAILNTASAGRRKIVPLTAGRRYRVNVTSFTAGAVIFARLRTAPFAERSVYVGNAINLSSTSNVIGSTTLRAAGTNRSATVGTTAVTLMNSNAGRQGWKIKNDSTGDLWINFDATATATAGGGNIRVPAGGYLASEPGFVETGAMSAIGSAAGLAITAREH